MKLSIINGLSLFAGFALVSLFVVQEYWLRPAFVHQQEQFSDRVNIALRSVGHQLLSLEGDKQSTIPPVKMISEHEYLLPLSRKFNYDTLAPLLNHHLEELNITEDYFIAIESCETEELVLGFYYSFSSTRNDPACSSRDADFGCANIKLNFLNPPAMISQAKSQQIFGSLAALLLFFLGAYQVWRKPKNLQQALNTSNTNQPNAGQTNTLVTPKTVNSYQLTFGESSLDINNQKINVKGKVHELTYRETKLLHLFAANPNQLLERDHIQQSVWEDEGIIVGRSLDVFVSRLRKILKFDESLKIANVRGIGYRLEERRNNEI